MILSNRQKLATFLLLGSTTGDRQEHQGGHSTIQHSPCEFNFATCNEESIYQHQ